MSLGGLDVGTNVCRLIAFDAGGRVLESSYRTYPLLPYQGRLEIDPEELWRAVVAVCSEIAEKTRSDPLEAIAVTAMGDSLIPTSLDFRPAGNAILAFDTRSQPECDRIVERLGTDKIYSKTGMPAHSMNTASKILWLLSLMGGSSQRRLRYMCAEDFVIARLTGSAVISASSAARTMLCDTTSCGWWSEILEYVGIEVESLSRISAAATAVETVRKSLAEQIGFSRPPVVVTGGHDQISCSVGAGAVRGGMSSVNTGTFECVVSCVDQERRRNLAFDSLLGNKISFYPHSPPGLWAAYSWHNAGSIVNWCRDTLFSMEAEQASRSGGSIYDVMFGQIDAAPSALQFLPHLTGTGTPWLDSKGEGVMVGFSLATQNKDILKAALLGIGYDLKINIENMEAAGIVIKEIRSTGGGSKSALWSQLKADMTGKRVTCVRMSEASSLGAAICAGAGIGRFGSIAEGAERMVALGDTYEPNHRVSEQFRDGLRRHLALYSAMAQYRREEHDSPRVNGGSHA